MHKIKDNIRRTVVKQKNKTTMSIVDDQDILINGIKNSDANRSYYIEQESPMAVTLRERHTIDDYARCLAVYKEVMQSYVQFFIDYWVKDNVNETNCWMTKELERVGIVGWVGLTEEENNPLGEYVLQLDFPASWSDMQTFFNRVMSGDLEFRCRYPMGNTNALDMIKGLGTLYK
jgi:hypothetical protein